MINYYKNNELDLVVFLRSALYMNGQKKKLNDLKVNNKYITTNFIEKILSLPEEIRNQHEFINPDAELIFYNLVKCFEGDVFSQIYNLEEINHSPIFIKQIFRILLDNKWESILKLINSIKFIPGDEILDSKNLIKNIMTIISFELQDRNVNFIQFHRSPFYSKVVHDFMFILSIGFIFASKFKIKQYDSIKNSIYTKQFIIKDGNIKNSKLQLNEFKFDELNELNILLKFENYYNVINKYYQIYNSTDYIFKISVKCIEGPCVAGRGLGGGSTDATKRRKALLHAVSGIPKQKRPERNPKLNLQINLNSNSNSKSGSTLSSNVILTNSSPTEIVLISDLPIPPPPSPIPSPKSFVNDNILVDKSPKRKIDNNNIDYMLSNLPPNKKNNYIEDNQNDSLRCISINSDEVPNILLSMSSSRT